MKRRPEVLAPCGDYDSMSAALAAGADAVYFGLDEGFNARARAANFSVASLPEVVARVHQAGAKAYVTLNTLVFEAELGTAGTLIEQCARAGVDALIVQDPAVALLARAICPAMEVHGSTQMTVASPLAAELMKSLGLTRVVVPRELSVAQIAEYAAGTSVPLEVFIHGALCVSWSGQCLSSELWGGRSANRGQCAQACRLPYELVVDGTDRPLGEVAYLLSPGDLVGSSAVPALAELGVASLKIEGRLKGPAYVATAVAHYRQLAANAVGEPLVGFGASIAEASDASAMAIAYSRGGSAGFLNGVDHQALVEGRFGRHRGAGLGVVSAVRGNDVLVVAKPVRVRSGGGQLVARDTDDQDAPLEPIPGMGVVFDAGTPDLPEQGGPIFAVSPWHSNTGERGYALRFGQPGPDLGHVRPGHRVWISSSPTVTKLGTRAMAAADKPLGHVALTVVVAGQLGMPLTATATTTSGHRTVSASATSKTCLSAASGQGLDHALLVDKLGGFGGTMFHVRALDCQQLANSLHLPASELKAMRRELSAQLEAAWLAPLARQVTPARDALATIAATATATAAASATVSATPNLVALCRTDAQLDALIALGATDIELDWMEFVGLSKAVERLRKTAPNTRITIATTRIQKPGEEKLEAHIAKLAPDAVLVRNWGALAYFLALPVAQRPTLHGDFSLNVTNAITARWVLDQGVATATCAHDLDAIQVLALLRAAPKHRLAVTLHHHMPTFHTEHCVYAHLLSSGADFRTCGRPCEQHHVSLRDRVKLEHPVVVDVGCRNTVFNAQAQSAAHLVPELLAAGVTRFRVEFVRENPNEVATVWRAYRQLLAGEISATDAQRELRVIERFGVTAGTMRTLSLSVLNTP